MRLSVRARLILAFVLVNTVVVGTAAVVLYKRPDVPPDIQGVFLKDPRELPEFKVIDQNGEPFTRRDLQGKWHIVSYGFTTCPDICPTTLAELATVAKQLPDGHEDLRFVFYSVDPKRDTPEQLSNYLPYFHPDFIGLTHHTDNEGQHLPFERGLGMRSELVPKEDGGYQVNHGVTLYLLNPAGELQAIFKPGLTRAAQPAFDPNTVLQDYLAVREYLG